MRWVRWVRRPANDWDTSHAHRQRDGMVAPLPDRNGLYVNPQPALPAPLAVPFPDDTTAISFEMGGLLDQAAAAVMSALEANPALIIQLSSYGEQSNTSSAGWQQSQKRLDSVTAALCVRGIPHQIIERQLRVADAPEVSSHTRAHVLIRVVPRLVSLSPH